LRLIQNKGVQKDFYVANNIAKWVCPYSQGGFVRVEPFLPYAEAKKILPRLMNKRIYPDLDFDYF